MERPATPRASLLLVDDHPANLMALEAILEPLGHELVTAPSGEEALRQILHRDFALILLDVQLGGMNGYETARLIKQHPRSRTIPIIFMTAFGRDADHLFHAYSQGAVDYLVKPFDPDILRAKVVVFVELYLKGETIKAQERLLRAQEREALERKSQERYRRLLDSMPQCVWATDAAGRMNYWNRAGLEYCGLAPEAVTEESLWERLHPDDRVEARDDWQRACRERVPFERPLRLRRQADGRYRWHLARAVPERDENGEIAAWIATATDIDDQKKAEEALQHAIVLRDDFLSVASHELRTPLTSLKLEVANLLRLARRGELDDSARLEVRVERIDAQAGRLHRLIDELLDVSRIAGGKLDLSPEDVDLVQLANEAVARLRDEAARLGSTIRVQAPPRASGQWDRGRLDQVITNLVANAIKYGGGKPIDLVVRAADDHVELVVSDQGVGIPFDDQGRIFGRFERAASTRNYGGIGLGLWIVKQIVDAFHGSVKVDSRPGAGSTFSVDLPRSVAPAPGLTVEGPDARRSSGKRALSPPGAPRS